MTLQQTIRQIRAELLDLAADGVELVPRPTAPAQAPPTAKAVVEPGEDSLDAIALELIDCTRCRLSEQRTHVVVGEGNPKAQVVFVGEGPGADEDRTGRPFVGKAGQLLDKMIEAVGWKRADVYICNVVKCRPPGNRTPELEEIATCRPFLERQIRAISPRAIVTLGKPAAATLLDRSIAITRERGIWREWNGIPLMPTFHPAYVLRQYTREVRQSVWDDLREVHARLEGN